MTSSRWTSHVYSDDHVLPQPGEVIMIRYAMSVAEDFNYGPRSNGTFGPPPATPSSAARRLKKPPFHYVIVAAVSPSSASCSFVIGFFPIVSYSTPPISFSGPVWDPVVWMEVQPQDTVLRHIPVPAVGWDPSPPALWGNDRLDFGGWRNSRPAWATTVQRNAAIPRTEVWRSLSPPVLLAPRDLATLKVFESTAVVHLLAHSTSITANHAEIQNYDGVWKEIFAPSAGDYDDSDDDDDENGSDTDPVSFWRYPGAPQAMKDMVQREDDVVRKKWEEGISSWAAGVTGK